MHLDMTDTCISAKNENLVRATYGVDTTEPIHTLGWVNPAMANPNSTTKLLQRTRITTQTTVSLRDRMSSETYMSQNTQLGSTTPRCLRNRMS